MNKLYQFVENIDVKNIERWRYEIANNKWLYTATDMFCAAFTGFVLGMLVGMSMMVWIR